ncbi:MAG: hypothetical protein MUF51_08525, partial [Vicinamibacteria bacterium]|nr:hypothetical protein [Vicinamibacteria bacterium]
LGQPPLSAPAVEVLKQIVWRAVQNIARACARQSVMDSASIQRIVLGLTARSLPELASDEP